MPFRPAGAALSLIAVAFIATGCSNAGQQQTAQKDQTPLPTHDRAADEAAIRANDSAWVKAIAASNAQQAMSYYTPDASLFAPGMPLATGTDAIGKAWAAIEGPGFALTFAPDKVVVSGDLAYEIGSYSLTTKDKKGKAHTANAKYIVVWARQPDGTWKAVIDAPTTTT